MANGQFYVSLADRSGETTRLVVPTVDLTPDLTDQSALATELDTLETTLQAITLGTMQKSGGAFTRRHSNQPGADGNRELKLRVTLEDDTTKKLYNLEVPCIDESSITFKTNSDEVDMGASPRGGASFDAFATALETSYRTPSGNTATVFAAELVGRNL